MAEVRGQLPVDRGWAWFVVLGYFISNFCMVGIAKSFGILLVEFVTYFKIRVAVAASIMGVCGGVYTLAAPVCVAAGQRFNQRRVVIVGGLVGSLGLTLSCLLFNIEWVIFTFGALFGLGNACIFGNGLVMVGMYFSKMRSVANGLALSGASIGQFLLPPLLQFLLDTFSLQGTLMIIGGVYLNVVVCGFLYRPASFYTTKPGKGTSKEKANLLENGKESEEFKPIYKKNVNPRENGISGNGDIHEARNQNRDMFRYRTSSTGSVVVGSVDSLHTLALDTENQSKSKMAEDNSAEKSDVAKKSCVGCQSFITKMIEYITFLKSYIVIMYTVLSFLLFFGHFNFILFMPASAQTRNITKYDKALLVSITGICDLFGRVLVGVTGDFLKIARYKLMAAATMFCSFAIFGFNLSQQYWTMATFVGLYGFFGGCYVAINAPVLIDVVGLSAMPKVLGVVLFIQGLGAAIGQPALGEVRDAGKSYEAVNYINGTFMFCGSIILWLYPLIRKLENKRTNKQAEDEVREEVMEMTVSP